MTRSASRDARPRASRDSTMWLPALLILLAVIPLGAFLNRIVHSDYLALAMSIPDDSYYYLLPAWRFQTHGFFTFDGVHRTYGFQPLFMVLLTGMSAILPSIEAVLRAAFSVNATLHVATGVLIGLVVNTVLSECSELVRYIASLVAGAVYLLGWNLFWVNLTLKENSLATFIYVLAILCLLRALSAPRQRSTGSDVWLGALIGLLILARLLPSSLLAAGVMLSVVWACLPRRSAIIIGTATLMPVLIWGIYAKFAFGHLLPSSMLIKAGGGGILGAVRHWRSVGFAEMFTLIGWYVRWAFSLFCDRDITSVRFLTREGFLVVGAGGLAICMAFAAWWSRTRTTIVLLAAASLAGLVAIPVLQYSTSKNLLLYSTWYLFDVSAILAIAGAATLGFLGQRGMGRLPARWANPRPAVVATLIAIVWVGAAAAEIKGYKSVPIAKWDESGCAGRDGPCTVVPDSSWVKGVVNAALWFRSEVPLAEGERAAAFDAGVVGMLLLPKPLVNLDGLANDDIKGKYLGSPGAWPSPALAEYISRERIRYVIDHIPPWTEWETVVGLKTELLMKTPRPASSVNPGPYVVHFLQPAAATTTER
jgi:hypothetical protein